MLAGGLAAVGLGGACVGWLWSGGAFAHGWLAAIVLCSGWPLGSMVLLCAHALTGGRWGDILRPALRAGVMTLPLLLLLLAPMYWLLPDLYAWTRPGAQIANGWYLNRDFFALRGAIYAGAWLLVAALTLFARRLDRIAAPALIVLAVTITFAAIDATMSLDPHFTSSLYGMLAGTGIGLLALSGAVLLSHGDAGRDGSVGKLLLALCILWTYLDFMQVLIVWQSDLVTQVPWYRARTDAGWGVVMAVVAATHSIVPIALLLSPTRQRDRRVLTLVATLLIAGEVLRVWWTVLPQVAARPRLLDFVCVLGAAGAIVALSLRCRRLEIAHA